MLSAGLLSSDVAFVFVPKRQRDGEGETAFNLRATSVLSGHVRAKGDVAPALLGFGEVDLEALFGDVQTLLLEIEVRASCLLFE